MVNPLGRSIGVNLPIYPLKGNVVTVPLKNSLEFNIYSPEDGSLICPLEPNLGKDVSIPGWKTSKLSFTS